MKTVELAELVGGELFGSPDVELDSVADIARARSGQLAFVDKSGPIPINAASCLLVRRGTVLPEEIISGPTPSVIVVANPKLAFSKAAQKILPQTSKYEDGQNTGGTTSRFAASARILTANIGAFVTVGEGSHIAEGCRIGDGTRIGNGVLINEDTVIHQNCVIYDNVEIGGSCVVHAGSVIGADGFGFVKDETGDYLKFPQIGTVVIEDNVEIGANTCIDRGALGETRIGEGTKIDNLVHVGHIVSIGKRCVIAAQTGISGSVTIEDDCVIGGQVGFGDHVTVKSGAVIGSQAGILPGKIVRPGVWWGTPIQPLDELKRQNAHLKAIGRLRADVKELKRSAKKDE